LKVLGSDKTAVRAGYAILITIPPGAWRARALADPPFFAEADAFGIAQQLVRRLSFYHLDRHGLDVPVTGGGVWHSDFNSRRIFYIHGNAFFPTQKLQAR